MMNPLEKLLTKAKKELEILAKRHPDSADFYKRQLEIENWEYRASRGEIQKTIYEALLAQHRSYEMGECDPEVYAATRHQYHRLILQLDAAAQALLPAETTSPNVTDGALHVQRVRARAGLLPKLQMMKLLGDLAEKHEMAPVTVVRSPEEFERRFCKFVENIRKSPEIMTALCMTAENDPAMPITTAEKKRRKRKKA